MLAICYLYTIFDIANNIIYSPVLYALAVFLEQGRKIWNETLSRIEVNAPDVDHLRTFYSCLYRSVLFPRSFYEIDAKGNTVHYSPYNGEVQPGYMFTDTGFWDRLLGLHGRRISVAAYAHLGRDVCSSWS